MWTTYAEMTKDLREEREQSDIKLVLEEIVQLLEYQNKLLLQALNQSTKSNHDSQHE